MANTLEMAEVHAMHALLERSWSRRRMAQVLGIDRELVDHLQLAQQVREAVLPAPPGYYGNTK